MQNNRGVRPKKTQQENIFASKSLSYFLQLTQTMNYTQAAQILGITQPALTQQIKKLERIVGAPLFYSVGKRLRLSEAGYTMLQTTNQVYSLLNKAADEIQQTTSENHGEIHLGILSSIESQVFEYFIVDYYRDNPDIQVSVHMLTRREIWAALESNKIDLAIMYLPDGSIKNWKPYDSKIIVTEDLLLIHNNEKLASKNKVKLSRLDDRKWVTYPVGFYLNDVITDAYKRELVASPDVAARFTQPGQIYRFLKETDTYTALPKSYIMSRYDRDEIMTANFEPKIKFDLSFVYRTEKQDIPRIDKFLTEFNNYLGDRDYFERLDDIVAKKIKNSDKN